MSYTQPNFDQLEFVDLFNVSCVEITNIIEIKWVDTGKEWVVKGTEIFL